MTKYLAAMLLFCATAFGQSWVGIVAPSRANDWGTLGLPATLPDGETTTNPWTPPTRTLCVTAACNTVAGGSVTATTIQAALNSAPAGTFVSIPAGTFGLGGSVTFNASHVTLRGSGAATTKLTGGDINLGNNRSWGGASFLTANPAKGATTIQVSSPPSAGRLAMLEQCDDGFSSSNAAGMTHFTGPGYANPCTGSYTDPRGPWVCGLNSICDRNGGGTPNPHFQTHVFWISNVAGSTVTLTSPLANANWSTARSAALTWLNVNGTAGSGVEGLTTEGEVNFIGTYACWSKGLRIITTSATAHEIQRTFDSHGLDANDYIAATQGGSGASRLFLGSDSGEQGMSDHLLVNTIFDGGYFEGNGGQTNEGFAYVYAYTSGNTAFVENGEFQHHAGTAFILREGNQMGYSLDDDTWGTHNFNTWFRNWISCKDVAFPSTTNAGFQIGSWARFENVVANVLGSGPSCTTYSNTFQTNTQGTDNMTVPTLFNWGNYVQCSGDARCNNGSFLSSDVPSNLASFGANAIPYQNPVPASQSFPASFLMSNMTAHPNGGTGLSWWKVCTSWTTFPTNCATTSTPPMPPIGPDVTGGQNMAGHAYNIPAALAFAALPVDNNYTTAWGHLKQFDERAFSLDPSTNNQIVQLTPTSSIFADTVFGQSTGPLIAQLANIGSGAVSISLIAISGDYSISSNTCGSTLPVSTTCNIGIIFTPTTVGLRTGVLTITDSATGSPHTVNLSGTGTVNRAISHTIGGGRKVN